MERDSGRRLGVVSTCERMTKHEGNTTDAPSDTSCKCSLRAIRSTKRKGEAKVVTLARSENLLSISNGEFPHQPIPRKKPGTTAVKKRKINRLALTSVTRAKRSSE
mmetsp:Transcript_4580/g.5166  ORF Transcript_4580/g.5166 Transcript_4580/m.5166 type:complete len:106 (+) Transcript_4580:2678-2995(+)